MQTPPFSSLECIASLKQTLCVCVKDITHNPLPPLLWLQGALFICACVISVILTSWTCAALGFILLSEREHIHGQKQLTNGQN